jgi:Protein of unknown function (DUF3365)
MKATACLAVSLVLGLPGCSRGPDANEQAALVAGAREAAASLATGLGVELKAAIAAQGPDGAIGVCKVRAPEMAAALSRQHAMEITRVSPRNRNPAGVPDAWEAAAQSQLEQRLAAGEKPESLDTWEVVSAAEGKQFRYAKALPTQPMCLLCHGNAADIPASVKARLAADYPDDKAVGYRVGMVRGIISIKRPL